MEVSRKRKHHVESTLSGRGEEMDSIRSFLLRHVKKQRPGSLFITGPPGTGKTATITEIFKSDTWLQRHRHVIVNCMVIRPTELFKTIANKLGIACQGSEKHCQQAVKEYTKTAKELVIVVLDEIDQLTDKVIASLLDWKIILIGVGNTFTITEATGAHQIINFSAYSVQDIVAILNEKFNDFEKSALEYCARKVAAVDGDLRKALDICRHAKAIARGTKRRRSALSYSQARADTINIQHIGTAFSSVYTESAAAICMKELPLQQTVALATLVTIQQKQDVTLGKFYDAFCKVCKKHLNGKCCQSDGEFFGLCDMLESRGLLALRKKKQVRLSTVLLKMEPADVDKILRQDRITCNILTHTLN